MFHFTIGHLSGINIPVQIYSNELVGELWIDTSNVLKAEIGSIVAEYTSIRRPANMSHPWGNETKLKGTF